jgi:hypothetical protein
MAEPLDAREAHGGAALRCGLTRFFMGGDTLADERVRLVQAVPAVYLGGFALELFVDVEEVLDFP